MKFIFSLTSMIAVSFVLGCASNSTKSDSEGSATESTDEAPKNNGNSNVCSYSETGRWQCTGPSAKKAKFIVHLINGEDSKEKIRQAIKDEKIEDEKKN